MDEREWLTCEDPDELLKFLGKKYSPRKLRLFACSCCRRVWDLLGDKGRRAVEIAERFADGQAPELELDQAADAAFAEKPYRVGLERDHNPAYWVSLRNAYKAAVDVSAYAAGWAVAPTRTIFEWNARLLAARAGYCCLLRDIVGNPFRSTPIDPSVLAWQGGTVVRLTQALYANHCFSDLPILADALEDAGCDNSDIHSHCRASGEHVRGCWAIDLLTGRC